jgi:hypothetical protein
MGGRRKAVRTGAPMMVKLRAADTLALREKLYAPLKIAMVVRVLSEAGHVANRVLSGTGLNSEQLANPNTRTSISNSLSPVAMPSVSATRRGWDWPLGGECM